ncbi:hypothetical protein ACIBBG_32580 [Micromonospora chersina]|uniref:hypothetical protein n=1 Tax=Micromonospora chersina TaxID=47854 RepID=UPI00378D94D1
MATIVTVASGVGVFAAPASAATGSTATLKAGTVTITGTAARDLIGITMDATQLVVDFDFDGTVDAQFRRAQYRTVRVLAGEGDDGISASGVGDVPLTINGGGGSDGMGVVGKIGEFGRDDALSTINGDDGDDTIFVATPGPVTVQAGAGDDRVTGGGAGIGQEAISLGAGNDRFVSSLNDFLGARSDTVDGGTGKDIMEVEGTFASESVGLSERGGHLTINRNLSDHIDADNVEDVTYFGFGGLDESGAGDAISVDSLARTDVVSFTPNFSADRNSTAPNNSTDTLIVRGTLGVDHITVSGSGANISVAGLGTVVNSVFLQSPDALVIDTLGGEDAVDFSGLQSELVQLQVR